MEMVRIFLGFWSFFDMGRVLGFFRFFVCCRFVGVLELGFFSGVVLSFLFVLIFWCFLFLDFVGFREVLLFRLFSVFRV